MVFILLIAYILFEENVLGGGSICVGQVTANHKIFLISKYSFVIRNRKKIAILHF
jgi:hypothetical protein